MRTNGAAAKSPEAHSRALLEALLRSDRRGRLCTEVARITEAPAPLVEDAFQEVCEHFLRGKCRGQTIGEVYNWLQHTTVRRVQRKRRRAAQRHELLVDSTGNAKLEQPPAQATEDEVIQREKERELSALVSTALAEIDERHRLVAALHSHGLRGPEIAQRLQTSERTVKRLTKRGLAGMREALVDAAGGGCEHGERPVSRLSFGLANAGERFAAQAHMTSCDECATLYRRLELAHEKIAALLPIPAVAEADPGLLERVAHKTAEAVAEVKQQAADAAGLAKQHASASYTRAVEYSPLATARPGAAATTAIAGCLALMGGGAAVCVDRGVDPFDRLVEVVRPEPAKPKPQPPRKKASVAQQTPDPPQVPPAAEPPPPAPAPEPQPAPAPAPAPAPPAPAAAPTPPPPPAPTPAGVQFGEPATPTATQTPAAARQPARPAPVPASGGSDLYGP